MLNDSSSQQLPDYDPTLDLWDYQYPTFDLLNRQVDNIRAREDAGLEAHKNQIINTLKNFNFSISKICFCQPTSGFFPVLHLYHVNNP